MLGSNPIQNVAGCPTSYGNGQSLNPILHVVMSHVIMVQGTLDEVLPSMNLSTHCVNKAQSTSSEAALNFGHEWQKLNVVLLAQFKVGGHL